MPHGQVHGGHRHTILELGHDDLALALGHAQHGQAVTPRCRMSQHGGVQVAQLVGAALGEARDGPQVHRAAQRDLVEVHRIVELDVVEPVLARIPRDRQHRHELGNVVLGLARQPQIPVVGGSLSLDGPQDGALAGVVGSEREWPVVEDRVEVLQVAGRRHGGLLRILALVHPLVDGQAEQTPGRAQELPRPDRGRRRARMQVETALHENQVDQVRRQSFLLEHLPEQGHVAARAPQPALEHRATGAGEVLDVPVDLRVELRLEALGRRGVENLGIGLVPRRTGRGGRRLGRVGRRLGSVRGQLVPGRIAQALEPGLKLHQVPPGGGVEVQLQGFRNDRQGVLDRLDGCRVVARLALRPGCLMGGTPGGERPGPGRQGVGSGDDSDQPGREQLCHGRGGGHHHHGGGYESRPGKGANRHILLLSVGPSLRR